MLRSPARAVGGNDDARIHGVEVVENPGNERREYGAIEVKTAHHRVQGPILGEATGIAADVHDSGVAAPGDDEQALVLDVDDERLVVEDERVRLPGIVDPRLLRRKAGLLASGAGVLTGD